MLTRLPFILLLGLIACAPSESEPSTTEESFLEVVQLDTLSLEDDWGEVPLDTPEYLNIEPLFTPEAYRAFRSSLADSLLVLRKMYQAAGTQARDSLQELGGNLLESVLVEQFFPCWYGTEWDFNGYTAIPQKGQIACGYFVSTPLLHAGFRLNRYRLAQQGAAEIIASLAAQPIIYRDLGFTELIAKLKALPEGLYVVGLSNHVGWIHISGQEVFFIHSTFVGPGKVIREYAEKSVVLEWSDIYVIGSISGNKKLMDSWLRNDTLSVVMTR